MYQTHWGLTGRLFSSRTSPAHFFESPTHEEALVCLQFLVEQQQRVGLLLGTSGSGKSLLLNIFAQALSQSGRQVVSVNLLGIDRGQFVHQLGTQLETHLPADATPATQWRSIFDRIAANRYQGRDTVFLLDDADEADREVLAQVARLAECDSSPQGRLTVVLAAHSGRAHRLGERLLELTELKIEIEPWDAEDTRGFLRHTLARAGVAGSIFGESAMDRLHELTRGVPRRVSQLAELALIAGAGSENEQIDGEIVAAAFEELAVQVSHPPINVCQ